MSASSALSFIVDYERERFHLAGRNHPPVDPRISKSQIFRLVERSLPSDALLLRNVTPAALRTPPGCTPPSVRLVQDAFVTCP